MHKIVNTLYAITWGMIFGLAVVVAVAIGIVGLFEAAIKRAGLMALALAFFSPLAFGQLVSQGNEQVVTYSGSTAFILQNVPAPNLLVTSGTNTFIMNVNPPSNAVRIYITNDTANSCANFTVSMAATGNTSLNSFNTTPGAWQSILLQNGATAGFTASNGVTLPASGTVYLTSAPVIGSKIAIFIVLSSGCATTNIDVQAVFGTFQSVSPNIQGVIPTGQNGSTENPVVCGGLDSVSLVWPCGVYHAPGAGVASINGLAIGAPNQSIAAGYINATMPNGNGGPLSVMPAAPVGELNASRYLQAQQDGMYTASKNCSNIDVACAGIYITKSGVSDNENIVNGAIGTQNITWVNYVAGGGTLTAYHSCRFDLNIGSVATSAGTGTVDFYVQDSGEISGTPIWTDRIHFPQIATSTTPASAHFWASIDSAQVSATCTAATCTTGAIVTQTDGTIPVNTVITGAPGKFLRFKYVVAGNAVTFAGGASADTFSVFCD